MKWETPAFVEINMSAEIGGYQSDFSDRDPWEPVGPRSGKVWHSRGSSEIMTVPCAPQAQILVRSGNLNRR